MAFVKSTSTISSNSVTVSGLSGGTNGKVVRISAANTAADAANTDTSLQLQSVLIKINDVYYSSGVVSGFTGLSPGSPYYLAGDGNLTPTPPSPSSSVRVLFMGFAINTTDLLMRVGTPISGT